MLKFCSHCNNVKRWWIFKNCLGKCKNDKIKERKKRSVWIIGAMKVLMLLWWDWANSLGSEGVSFYSHKTELITTRASYYKAKSPPQSFLHTTCLLALNFTAMLQWSPWLEEEHIPELAPRIKHQNKLLYKFTRMWCSIIENGLSTFLQFCQVPNGIISSNACLLPFFWDSFPNVGISTYFHHCFVVTMYYLLSLCPFLLHPEWIVQSELPC
jgi:hypothetical protein